MAEQYNSPYTGPQIDEALRKTLEGETSGDIDLSGYAPLNKPHFKNGIICGIGVSDNDCGKYSIIVGSSKAPGESAAAFGGACESNGKYSSTFGVFCISGGESSHAEGQNTKATNRAAHAEGSYTEASGEFSHAEGTHSIASGTCAHAENNSDATGNFSHAGGSNSVASGYASFVQGSELLASAPYQTVFGVNNVEYTNTYTKLIIGKGMAVDTTGNKPRANCFRVTDTGVFASGEYNSSGADYAELFEWADGNPDAEDRCGRFVTLDGEKIRLALTGDDYILGIVSGNPSVVGDVYDDQWQGMYEVDVFGRPVYEWRDFPAETLERPGPDGEMETIEIRPARREWVQKINLNYDPEQKYIPRSERPEWDAVGMLGKLITVDDGTCQVNGWAAVGADGAATASAERTKFRVMSRLDETHIRIMIFPG